MGGPYFIYILLGLKITAIHSLLALVGVFVIGWAYPRFNGRVFNMWHPILMVFGETLLLLSLIIFFQRSKGYNNGTFHQTIPLFSLVLAGVLGLVYLLLNLRGIGKGQAVIL